MAISLKLVLLMKGKAIDGQKKGGQNSDSWQSLSRRKASSVNLMSTYHAWGHCQMLWETVLKAFTVYWVVKANIIIFLGRFSWMNSLNGDPFVLPSREHHGFILFFTFRALSIYVIIHFFCSPVLLFLSIFPTLGCKNNKGRGYFIFAIAVYPVANTVRGTE